MGCDNLPPPLPAISFLFTLALILVAGGIAKRSHVATYLGSHAA